MAGKIKFFILKYIEDNILVLLFIAFIFSLGIFFGALGVKSLNTPQVQDLVTYIDGFINNLPTANVDVHQEIKHALTQNLKILFYYWFLGLTVIGIPLTMAITFTRGFVLGFTVGFLVEQKAGQGILVVLLTVVPQNFILVPVILIAAVLSINFSLYVVRGKFQARSLDLSKKFVSYSLSFFALALLGVCAALIQGYVSPNLIKAVFYLT